MSKPKPKMIRGVTARQYAKLMHRIENSKSPEKTERSLVRRGLLKKSTKGILPTQRSSAKIFRNKDKTKGKGKPGQCRVPKCEKDSSRRGLCNTHRIEARRMIRSGKTTEQNLINRGLLLPKASGGDRKGKLKPRSSKPKRKRHTKKKKLKISTRAKTKKRGTRFPAKLLNSTICLFKGCKTTRLGGSRGLCVKHYSQYKRKKSKLSDRKKRALERDLVRRKLLLPPKEKATKKIKRKTKKRSPESSAFEIGSTVRGSVHHYY